MNIKKFFRRKEEGKAQEQTAQPQPLAIEGIPPAPLTPEPDDAEIAAQALLEHMSQSLTIDHEPLNIKADASEPKKKMVNGSWSMVNETRNADYYRHLARKMRAAREETRLRVTRFLAFCEQELKKPHLPTFGGGSLGLLEAELYKRLDIVEHEGGELLRRWQHCLALVTVRLMQATRKNENENSSTTEDTDSSSTTN